MNIIKLNLNYVALDNFQMHGNYILHIFVEVQALPRFLCVNGVISSPLYIFLTLLIEVNINLILILSSF